MIRTAKITVTGRVQGVGFRWFVQHEADKIGLGGTVKNLPDGSVEVYAQGIYSKIKLLMTKLSVGNGVSRTDDVKFEEIETGDAFDGFKIIH